MYWMKLVLAVIDENKKRRESNLGFILSFYVFSFRDHRIAMCDV